MSERIQKFLATLGVASRREVERMIDEGRIEVNGKPAEPGQHVDRNDNVRIDGRPVAMQRKAEAARVLIYKKRTGELVTRDDPEGRRTVFRKLPKLTSGRWIAIGRLDINTSGLLLFTNHGELARRLTHPSFEVPRTYAVRILGTVDDAVIARWKAGVELEDGLARFERVETGVNEDGEGANQWFHVTVREGRNRLVRRLIESQKLQVSRLIRISYGPIELGRGIKSGTAREATPAELLALLDAVGMSGADVGLEPASRSGRAARAPTARGVRGKPVRRSYRDDDDDDRREDAAARAPRASRQARDAGPADRRAVRADNRQRAVRDERDPRAGRPRRDDGQGPLRRVRDAAAPGARRAADARSSTRVGDGRPSPVARGRSASKSKPKHPPRTRR